MTPTQRSKALYLELGYQVEVVERWVPGANVRKDVFGIGDLLAVHPRGRMVLVQTTTANIMERVRKLIGNTPASDWMRAGGEIHFNAWTKTGPRGKRKTWTCRLLLAVADPSSTDGFRVYGLRKDLHGKVVHEAEGVREDLF